MDKGEWSLLKQNGLAGKLSDIFSGQWQRNIQSATSVEILEEMYQERFGDQYQAINEFRQFLDTMESRSEVIAYSLSDDHHATD
jgi:predicted nucleic acid-binding protein